MDRPLSMMTIHKTPFVRAEDTKALRILDRCPLNCLGPEADTFLRFSADDF